MNIEMKIFSPRWGHDDTYILELSNEQMVFRQASGPWPSVLATRVEGADPEWKNREGLFSMLNNDGIYPSHKLPDLIEYLWSQWYDRALSNEDVQAEADALVEFVNQGTRSKPDTNFWQTYF